MCYNSITSRVSKINLEDEDMQGIRLQAHPNIKQKKILSQWMGCARLIWNAKYEDEAYMTRYAIRYCPIGTYAPIDQTFSQYKSLSDCPSQILRNSAVNWYKTYGRFMQGWLRQHTCLHLRPALMAIYAY